MYWGQSDCDRELQRKLDDERYARERAEDLLQREQEAHQRAAVEARRARMIERETYWHEAQRSASTWPEALRKQIPLMNAEVYSMDPVDDIGAWFAAQVAACERAHALWEEEQAKVQPAIDALQRQIDALRDGIRFAVAARLEDEQPEADSVAEALRTVPEDADELSAWLNW